MTNSRGAASHALPLTLLALLLLLQTTLYVPVCTAVVAEEDVRAQPPLCRKSSLPLSPGSGDLRAAAADANTGHIYIPMFSQASVVRVSTHPFTEESVLDTSPHTNLISAAIDSVAGYAYFTTYNTGMVLRAATGAFDSFEALPLYLNLSNPDPAAGFWAAAVDGAEGFGYFIETSGEVVKVDLATFTFVDRLVLNQPVRTTTIDTENGFLYCATRMGLDDRSRVYKIRTSDLTINATFLFDDREFFDSSIDHVTGYAFFTSTYKPPGGSSTSTVTRVSLDAAGTFNHTLDTTYLSPDDTFITSFVVDSATGTGFLGTDTELDVSSSLAEPSSRVIALNLTTFSVIGDVQLDSGETSLLGAAVDPTNRTAYFVCRGDLQVVRFTLAALSCSGYDSCGECDEGCGCGWCATTQTCEKGDPRGSFDGASCAVGDDEWDYAVCYECSSHGTCDECITATLDPGAPTSLNTSRCGWCGERARCLRGRPHEPMPGFGSCDAWEYHTCPNCANHTDCDACGNDDECGWCPSAQACVPGDELTPYNLTCAAYTFDYCPLCNYTDCGSCTSDSDCAWCAKNRTCHYGDASGPYVGECAGGRVSYSTCPVCEGLTCTNCTAEPECGWCASELACYEGDVSGEFVEAPTCAVWDYQTCPQCGAYDTCDNCTADPLCGWCADTLTCSRGDVGGVFGGTCDWEFSACVECGAPASAGGPGNCSECAQTEGCGWCAATQACERGSDSVAYGGSCGSEWESTQCRNCSAYDCDVCALDDECGWCASEGRCVDATPAGTPATTCDVFDYDFCRACSNHTTCEQCAADAQCVYCEEDGCVAGGSEGPHDADAVTCSAYKYLSCAECNYTSCGECTADAECGWCASTQSCAAGLSGSGPFIGTCDLWDWDCPPCESAGNCSTCQAVDPRCGWCGGEWSCLRVGMVGSGTDAAGVCDSGWKYENCTDCTFGNTGSGSGSGSTPTTCDECLTPECGWCADSGECVPGDPTGPFDPAYTCGESTWAQFTCTDCSLLTSCDECGGAAACGWCEESQTCVEGSSSGPAVGTCALWDYASCNITDTIAYCSSVVGSCDGCLATEACAWCAETQTCSAELLGENGCSTEYWDSDSCGVYCELYTGCSSCIGTYSECGWCNTTGECVDEASAGACDNWVLYGDSCVVPGEVITKDLCAEHGTCRTCTTDEEVECGWDSDKNICVAVDGDYPRVTLRRRCPDFVLWAVVIALAVLVVVCVIILLIYCLVCRSGPDQPLGGEVAPPESDPEKGDEIVVDRVREVEEFAMATGAPAAAAAAPAHTSPPRQAPARRVVDIIPRPYVELCAKDSILDGLGERLFALEQLLTQGNMYLASALCRVVSVAHDGESLSRALVTDFTYADLASPLMRMQIYQEAATFTGNANTMFRENSLASKLMKAYAQIEGVEWLFNTLVPVVEYVARVETPLSPPQGSYAGSDGSEVARLLSVVDVVLNHILASGRDFPRALRIVCMHLKRESAAVAEAAAPLALGNFVFLRFINPALCSPYQSGLVTEMLPQSVINNLKVIAKVLSSIAFNTARSDTLVNCNAYIASSAPRVTAWLSSLGDPDGNVVVPPRRGRVKSLAQSGLPTDFGSRSMDCRVLTETPLKARDEALAEIYNTIIKYIEELRVEMGAVVEHGGFAVLGSRKPFDLLRIELSAEEPSDALLVEMLLSDDLAIVAALCDVASREEHAELTTALLDVFEAHEQGLRLLRAITVRELRSADHANAIFRPFHMASHLMRQHSNVVGAAYRTAVVGPTVRDVIAHPTDYEIDPEYLPPHASGRNNLRNMLEAVGTLLDSVFNSLADCPVHMRIMADHLSETVGDRFRDEWYVGPGRYFFDYFICEALSDPTLLGVAEVPSPMAKRALALMRTIVLKLVTSMQVGVEHRYMRSLNEFIENNIKVMRRFLRELARVPTDAPAPWAFVVPPEALAGGMRHIRYLLQFYIENADFYFYYHYYYFYHNDESEASSEDERRDLGLLTPDSPEARIFFEMERIIIGS